MTFLEKAREIDRKEGKNKSDKAIIRANCPYDYGLENNDECNKVGENKCVECWNREMPDTDKSVLVTNPEFEPKIVEKMIERDYKKGLNDAWEFMKKWDKMTCEQSMDIFGTSALRVVLDKHTPQEALAKLKAYEEAQNKVEVGDVVLVLNEFPMVVTNISNNMIFGVDAEGLTSSRLLFRDCKKTGKHINIEAILEQIGE